MLGRHVALGRERDEDLPVRAHDLRRRIPGAANRGLGQRGRLPCKLEVLVEGDKAALRRRHHQQASHESGLSITREGGAQVRAGELLAGGRVELVHRVVAHHVGIGCLAHLSQDKRRRAPIAQKLVGLSRGGDLVSGSVVHRIDAAPGPGDVATPQKRLQRGRAHGHRARKHAARQRGGIARPGGVGAREPVIGVVCRHRSRSPVSIGMGQRNSGRRPRKSDKARNAAQAAKHLLASMRSARAGIARSPHARDLSPRHAPHHLTAAPPRSYPTS